MNPKFIIIYLMASYSLCLGLHATDAPTADAPTELELMTSNYLGQFTDVQLLTTNVDVKNTGQFFLWVHMVNEKSKDELTWELYPAESGDTQMFAVLLNDFTQAGNDNTTEAVAKPQRRNAG